MDIQDEKSIYTALYCEENIYKLTEMMLKGKKLPDNVMQQLYAIFLTNPMKQTHIKYQSRGDKKNKNLVVWDYHVILIKKLTESIQLEDGRKQIKQQSFVYDYDTTLGFRTPFEQYFQMALQNPPIQTCFRVVGGEKYVDEFASDRSHMIKKVLKEGTPLYQSPPPQYELIRGKKSEVSMNLMSYLDVEEKNLGQWMNQEQFYNFFKIKQA